MSIQPRSRAQRKAFQEGHLPPVEEVTDGIFAIPVPMDGSSLYYSLAYAIQGNDRDVHLIDTGIDSEDNWMALQNGLSSIGHTISEVASVTVSHLHRDHAGMAARLRSASGAIVRMHASDARALQLQEHYVDPERIHGLLDEWGVPSEARDSILVAALSHVAGDTVFVIDEELTDCQTVHAGSHHLRVLHTPGHTRGHIVLVDDDAKLAFTGDHLLPMMNSGVGLGGWSPEENPVADYLDSLARIAALDLYEACPGHGYRFTGIAARSAAGRAHLLRRGSETTAIVSQHPELSIWQVASRVPWSAGWENLREGHLLSAVMQTVWHIRGNSGGC